MVIYISHFLRKAALIGKDVLFKYPLDNYFKYPSV